MKIEGWNDFYDGWIACLLGFSKDESKNMAWKEGWDTGNETPCVRDTADVIIGSIKRDYIKVEE